MLKIAINGFGRIGRLALRAALLKHKDRIEVAAINTSGNMDAKGWAHLFEYDSTFRKFPGKVETDGECLVIDGQKIPLLAQREPKNLPWGRFGVEVVLECTGVFRKAEEVKDHLEAGAGKVLVSAPPKGGEIPIFIVGINANEKGEAKVFSNASCTTNCVVPVAKVINDAFGVIKAGMTTIHAYTSDQRLLDNSHSDLRRARSAAINIVPTSTGAAEAVAAALPEMKGIFDGMAIRVPVVTGSLTDFTFLVKKKVSAEEVNKALIEAAEGELKGVLGVTDKPVVSSDVIGCDFSSLVDLEMTRVIDGDLIKILSWYDNEWGYVNRMLELILV